jgi:hypothetical protein
LTYPKRLLGKTWPMKFSLPPGSRFTALQLSFY